MEKADENGQKNSEMTYIDAFFAKKEQERQTFLEKCVDNTKSTCYNNVYIKARDASRVRKRAIKTRISFMERCYVMKHSQVQLASKRNFRLMALAVMLVLMVCCTALWVSAANNAIVFDLSGAGFTFNAEGGYWEAPYGGSNTNLSGVTVTVDGAPAEVKSATLSDPNVGETFASVTIVYGEDQTATVPVKINPLKLEWNDGIRGSAEVSYNASGEYNNVTVTVPANALNTAPATAFGHALTVEYSNISFATQGCDPAVAFSQVVLKGEGAGNYSVDPLPVDVTVKRATINTVDWSGLKDSFVYGDADLANIKAVGDSNVPLNVVVQIGNEWVSLAEAGALAAGEYKLNVAFAGAHYVLAEGVDFTTTITVTKANYALVLNNGEFVSDGDLANPNASFGYVLTVSGKDGASVPQWILSAITYEYTNAQGQKVTKVTEPGVYSVKAIVPTFDNAEVTLENDTATLTVLANYKVVLTPDGAIVLTNKDGIASSIEATVTVPEKLARPALRGLDAYKAYTLSITGAGNQAFSVRIPVSKELVGENLLELTLADLYIYNSATGTKEAANGKYTVSMSQDGSYYIIDGYVAEGEITLMIAPAYVAPFWGSAIGIALIVFLALVLIIVVPMIIGLFLLRLERSGRNPVISVETKGNVPEVEPVVIPDKIDDPDAILEDGLENKVEALTEEVAAETEEIDVDATDAVAEAMADLNAEVAEIDLGNADGALEDMTDQLVLDLMDQVAAAEDNADVSEEVQKAVAEAMAENFNESADATDAVALITEEEVEEEAPVEEVVEEAPVQEPAPEAEEAEEEDEESFGGFGSMGLTYIDAIAEAERYAEMLEQERRGEVQLVTRYRRSYLSRLAQSQGSIQDYYNAIKNLLLSYKGVKSRISWGFESFNVGRTPLAKFNAKTRTLYVYIALSPEELADTKYNFADMSEKKKYAAVPVLLKVKGDRKFKHALELITKLCEEKLQLPKKKNFTEEDYRTPFKTTEELVQEGTVKMMVAAIPVAAPVADEAVVEEAPAEEAVVEEAIEETPVEEAVVEEAIEETPVEEAVVEEATEEAPAEEAVEENNENA